MPQCTLSLKTPFQMNKHYKNWLIQAPFGLILIGFGACLIAESAILKATNAETWQWVVAGTVSLSVFNAGLCFFGNSILERMRYERKLEEDRGAG
jgi:hypothetical protein